jgi:hypothetical protein
LYNNQKQFLKQRKNIMAVNLPNLNTHPSYFTPNPPSIEVPEGGFKDQSNEGIFARRVSQIVELMRSARQQKEATAAQNALGKGYSEGFNDMIPHGLDLISGKLARTKSG